VHFNFPGSSCATALPWTYGQTVNAEVDVAGKQFHWALHVTKGDFLQFAAIANPNDEAGKLDTALTLFDAQGKTVRASIDDGFPRHGSDAWLFYRVAQTETLCVRVEDYSTWAHSAPQAFPGQPFALTVVPMPAADAGIAVDTEPNDTATAAQAFVLKQYAGMPGGEALIYGGLDGANDIDVYRVSADFGSTVVSFNFPPFGDAPATGVSTCGSTLVRTAARVTRLDGTVLGGLEPPAMAPNTMSGSMEVVVDPSADYLLWVTRPVGEAAGANDFYASTVTTSVDNPPEHETNDTVASAEPLMMLQQATKLRTGFILGHISPPQDIDVFSFTANAGDTVGLKCRAQRAGSGLRGATFVLSSAMATMQGETENETRDVTWVGQFGSLPPVGINATGTYYLKVHTVAQDPTNTGNYYRCSVLVQSP
jgi:hypothetical protein